MKKYICFVIALIMCLSLCACGKSEAVVAYEELITEIGSVTLESEEAILAAENAYKALTDEEKESVAETKAVLSEKRSEYDALVVEAQEKAEQEKRINSVVTLIDAIGKVTLDSESEIVAAEKAYNNLSKEEQAMIADAAKILSECRTEYDAVEEQYMAMRAKDVFSAIDAIGTVTLDSESVITNARNLYNKLSAEARGLVANYSILEKAEKEFDELYEAEKKRIIDEYSKKFNISTDAVEGTTWYIHKNLPPYIDIRSYVIPFVGVNDNIPWICIRYNYTGDDWIFWEKLTIVVDGEKFYKSPNYFDITHDNDSEVWEYYEEVLNFNQAMDTDELQLLKAIGNSKETIIRFQGDNYHYDLYVTDTDKQIIKDALALYEALIS